MWPWLEEGQIEEKGKRVVGHTDPEEEGRGGRNGYYWIDGKELMEPPLPPYKPCTSQ